MPRWLLKEREEFLAQAKREADDILEAAQVQAARMVERTEVAREANRVAQSVVTAAEAESRQLKHEAEDYVDQKLAAFEVVLERTMQAVQKGRDRLQVVVEPLEDELVDDRVFFDQDRRVARDRGWKYLENGLTCYSAAARRAVEAAPGPATSAFAPAARCPGPHPAGDRYRTT